MAQRMLRAYKQVVVLFLIAACGCLARSQDSAPVNPFSLHDGETVVFYGDSITAQRFYTRFVEDFVLTRYPALRVQFVNAGVPGDTTYGGYAGAMAERVGRDVAPYHPNMITIMLGMNDGGYGYTPIPVVLANFDKGYDALLAALHEAAPNAAFTFINPTPYDEITHGTEFPGYEGIVSQLSDEVTKISKRPHDAATKVMRADFHEPVLKALKHASTAFPQLAPLLIPDRIHPAETTHWIMAAALLRAWHVDPAVSRVSLNADTPKILMSDRAAVTELHSSPTGISWSELDEALPLPLDLNNAMTKVMLDASSVEDLDKELLQVEGLHEGQYQLLIDTKPIATFSAEQLKHGVNLALQKTPMLDQARRVDYLEERRAQLDMSRFILSAEVKQEKNTQLAEDGLREAQQELDTTMRAKLMPKPHSFELRRQ